MYRLEREKRREIPGHPTFYFSFNLIHTKKISLRIVMEFCMSACNVIWYEFRFVL